MSDSVFLILNGIVSGFRDSIVGMLKVYKMDSTGTETDDDTVASVPVKEAQTVLAKRRAARMKTTPGVSNKDGPPKVCQRIFMCCMWNGGLCWLSIVVFNGLVIPGLQYCTQFLFGGSSMYNIVWSYMGPTLTVTFSALWVLPLFVLSKVVNFFWFQDIADAAYRKLRGRPQLPSLGKFLADSLFSVLLQSLFLLQACLVQLLPIHWLADFISKLHMCLLYSLYSFEYKWFNMGWELHKRLSYIECNWPYFVGFGLPLALLTALPSSFIISGCLFSILFPLFIVSANEAEPVRHIFDFQLRLFSPAVTISNILFLRLKKPTVEPTATGLSPSLTSLSASPRKRTVN